MCADRVYTYYQVWGSSLAGGGSNPTLQLLYSCLHYIIYSGHLSHHTRIVDPMLCHCWPTVYNVGLTLTQHWVDVSCPLATDYLTVTLGTDSERKNSIKLYHNANAVTKKKLI